MPGIADTPNDFVLRFKIDAEATAANADTWPLFIAESTIVITAVRWIPNAVVTGVVTNNFALAVQDIGPTNNLTQAVTAVVTYGSGTNSVANVPETYALSATAANLLVAKGDVLALIRTVNGTGLASPRGTLEVQYRYR